MNRPVKLSPAEVQDHLSHVPGWQLSKEGMVIERHFKFKNFDAAWAFMGHVAGKAQQLDHHPEWRNVYNQVFICLTTHDAGGLSMLDFTLAAAIDVLYSEATS